MGDIIKLLFKEKPVKLLLTLYKKKDKMYIAPLSREVDSNEAYTVNLVKKLESLGLIKSSKEKKKLEGGRDGRIKLIELTETGYEIADEINTIIRKIQRKGRRRKRRR